MDRQCHVVELEPIGGTRSNHPVKKSVGENVYIQGAIGPLIAISHGIHIVAGQIKEQRIAAVKRQRVVIINRTP
jgi:hypothetical protein